ncbi:MAG: V-type ATP synthase subunit E, partial [Chloroflexota bacterium]
QDARERAVTPAYRERARILHRARLEALRTVGDARETAINAVLAQTRIMLSQIRSTPAYPSILRRLAEESLAELERSLEDPGAAHLEIDARDEALMAEIIKSLGLQAPISCTLECWGGLVASSQDGRIVVINTLESRLDRALPFLRRDLAALLENGGA